MIIEFFLFYPLSFSLPLFLLHLDALFKNYGSSIITFLGITKHGDTNRHRIMESF